MNKMLKQLPPGSILTGVVGIFFLPVVLLMLFPAQLDGLISKGAYLAFHNTAEFFSIMVSLAVFSVGWNTFAQSKDRHALFLGVSFLAVGLLDFMHTMSNAAMPAFLTPNDTNKSTLFWLSARLTDASALLASAYVFPASRSRWLSKRTLMTAALAGTGIVFTSVTFFPEFLPATAVPGTGITPLKRILEFLVIFLLLTASAAYWKRMSKTGDRRILYYLSAFVIGIYSEILFASYTTGFDTYNVLGHIYKVLAFYLFYRGVFVAAVESPYLALSEANENLLRETVSRKELAKEVEERERIAKALAESEGRLRLFFDHAPAALAMLDREMRYLFVSRRWLSDYGLGERNLRGLSHYDVFPGIPEKTRNIHRRGLAGEVMGIEIERFTHPDGRFQWIRWEVRPWFSPAGEIGGIVIFTEDVTERKRAEDRLNLLARTAGELLRSDSPQRVVDRLCADVMDFLGCDVFFNFLVDEEAGRLRLNAYAGIPEEEARRIEWLDYGSAVCGCAARDGCRIVAEEIAATPDPRTELVKSYGVQAYACHPLTAQGRVLGTLSFGTKKRARFTAEELSLMKTVADHVAIAVDRKIYEEELLRARRAADAANQAKSDFLAQMSHEIRTPINGITGMTELALMAGVDDKPREYLRLVKQSARSLLDIINDILDLSKIEAGRVELERVPFSPGATAEAVVNTLEAIAARKGFRLTCEVAPDVPPVLMGDEGRLRQVLTNLVGNAVKFTERGAVEVQVAALDRAIPDSPARSRLLFSVRDTGIGIPADQLDSVFETFTQVKRSSHAKYGGTGLGLSISKQLVELMGGEIHAESEPERGSLFSFTAEFDLAEEKALQPEAPAAGARKTAVGPLRILVAEDNPVNQLFLREILEGGGHEVRVAGNGREALEALAHEPFDLVLLDVQMPEMDGLETARRIRGGAVPGVDSAIPLIALTAHAIKGDRERFLAAGMDDYLSKPIDLSELEQRLAGWAGIRRPPGGGTPHRVNGKEPCMERARKRLADLLSRLPPAKVWGLLDQAMEQMVPALDRLAARVAAADARGAAEDAHRLRGTWTVVLGTDRMIELAAGIERLAESGATAEAEALVEDLRTEAAALHDFLRAERDARP